MVVHPETPLEVLFNVIITVLGNNCRDIVEIESDDDAQKPFILMKNICTDMLKEPCQAYMHFFTYQWSDHNLFWLTLLQRKRK